MNWGLFCFCLHSILLLLVQGEGVISLVNGETLPKLRSELWLYALLATIIDFTEALLIQIKYFPLLYVFQKLGA